MFTETGSGGSGPVVWPTGLCGGPTGPVWWPHPCGATTQSLCGIHTATMCGALVRAVRAKVCGHGCPHARLLSRAAGEYSRFHSRLELASASVKSGPASVKSGPASEKSGLAGAGRAWQASPAYSPAARDSNLACVGSAGRGRRLFEPPVPVPCPSRSGRTRGLPRRQWGPAKAAMGACPGANRGLPRGQ